MNIALQVHSKLSSKYKFILENYHTTHSKHTLQEVTADDHTRNFSVHTVFTQIELSGHRNFF